MLGFGLFFVAARGGLGGARATLQKQSRGANRAVGTVFVVLLLGFGVALPVALLIGNHDNASAQVGGLKLTAGEKAGRELFGEHCGVCHTLSARQRHRQGRPQPGHAQAPSLAGPAHDRERLPAQRVRGSAEQCLGQGVMPANVVQGRDAQNVLGFVARVAGNE